MHQIVWPRRILHLAQIGFSLHSGPDRIFSGPDRISLGQIGFSLVRVGFFWSGSIFDLDQKKAIRARSKSGPGHRAASGPDLVLAGSKSGRATRFSLAQMEKTWSRRPDLGVSGPEVRHLAQRLLMGNSIWPRAAFHLVGAMVGADFWTSCPGAQCTVKSHVLALSHGRNQ